MRRERSRTNDAGPRAPGFTSPRRPAPAPRWPARRARAERGVRGGGGGRGVPRSVLTFLVPGPPAIQDMPVREEERPGCPPRVSCWGDIASMKKTRRLIPAQEEAPRSSRWNRGPEGRGCAGPRRPPRSGREPGSGCGQRASRRGHGPPPAIAPHGGLEAIAEAPAGARPARGPPLRAGPAPGRLPPARRSPAAGLRRCGPAVSHRHTLGHPRPADLLGPPLRVGPACRSSRVGVAKRGLRCTDARLSRRPAHAQRFHPFPRPPARGGWRRCSACISAAVALEPERRSCRDSCLALSGRRGVPPPSSPPPPWRPWEGAVPRRAPRLCTLGGPQRRLTSRAVPG